LNKLQFVQTNYNLFEQIVTNNFFHVSPGLRNILMVLAIECVHNLPPHLSYVNALPDITQKPKNYVVFLSIVWLL